MNQQHQMLRLQDALNRRSFLSNSAGGLGLAALAGLGAGKAMGDLATRAAGGLVDLPHMAAKAKRVI